MVPLPLVPATWMAGQVCGVYLRSRAMRLKPSSIMLLSRNEVHFSEHVMCFDPALVDWIRERIVL
jgi:hypothetical protein